MIQSAIVLPSWTCASFHALPCQVQIRKIKSTHTPEKPLTIKNKSTQSTTKSCSQKQTWQKFITIDNVKMIVIKVKSELTGKS